MHIGVTTFDHWSYSIANAFEFWLLESNILIGKANEDFFFDQTERKTNNRENYKRTAKNEDNSFYLSYYGFWNEKLKSKIFNSFKISKKYIYYVLL